MRLSRVLLPQPLGPMMDTNSPGRTRRLTATIAATACGPWPYRLAMESNRTATDGVAVSSPCGRSLTPAPPR